MRAQRIIESVRPAHHSDATNIAQKRGNQRPAFCPAWFSAKLADPRRAALKRSHVEWMEAKENDGETSTKVDQGCAKGGQGVKWYVGQGLGVINCCDCFNQLEAKVLPTLYPSAGGTPTG